MLTGEPLEYPRSDLPGHVRLVGAQLWDPPAEAPAWLDEPGDPWVLVTTSTEYQADEELARVAVEALRDEPVRVLLTLADAYDSAELPPAANVRVERFVAHAPVLERAAAVVSHSGMGIVQKAIAAGVPIAAVPFGRDQPEVARRVVEAGAGVQLRIKDLDPERLRATVREALAMRPSAQAAAARMRGSAAPRASPTPSRSLPTATGMGRRYVLSIDPSPEETRMSRFAHVNLFDVEDSISARVAGLEGRFARKQLESRDLGVSHFRYAPGFAPLPATATASRKRRTSSSAARARC